MIGANLPWRVYIDPHTDIHSDYRAKILDKDGTTVAFCGSPDKGIQVASDIVYAVNTVDYYQRECARLTALGRQQGDLIMALTSAVNEANRNKKGGD